MPRTRVEDIKESIMNTETAVKTFNFAPTGSYLLDMIVGGGIGEGYPFGSTVNIVGDSSAGKTLLSCEIIAACHYKLRTSLSGFMMTVNRVLLLIQKVRTDLKLCQ